MRFTLRTILCVVLISALTINAGRFLFSKRSAIAKTEELQRETVALEQRLQFYSTGRSADEEAYTRELAELRNASRRKLIERLETLFGQHVENLPPIQSHENDVSVIAIPVLFDFSRRFELQRQRWQVYVPDSRKIFIELLHEVSITRHHLHAGINEIAVSCTHRESTRTKVYQLRVELNGNTVHQLNLDEEPKLQMFAESGDETAQSDYDLKAPLPHLFQQKSSGNDAKTMMRLRLVEEDR